MYKMIIFKKGADSYNLQYDDVLSVVNNIAEKDIDKMVNKFIDCGYYQLAEYKIVKEM